MVEQTSMQGGPGPFPNTSWSLIQRCQSVEPVRTEFDQLIRRYWPPVYYFISRNWTRNSEEAKDLTQAFFLAFLEKDYLEGVAAEKGRFRSFVCAALRNFLSKQKRAAQAAKRRPPGGVASLDALAGEAASWEVPDPTQRDPVEQFNEDWRAAVLRAAVARLRETAAQAGKLALFEAWIEYDLEAHEEAAGPRPTHDALSQKYGLTRNQVRNGLAWVRPRFIDALRGELTELVASEEDLRGEAQALLVLEL